MPSLLIPRDETCQGERAATRFTELKNGYRCQRQKSTMKTFDDTVKVLLQYEPKEMGRL